MSLTTNATLVGQGKCEIFKTVGPGTVKGHIIPILKNNSPELFV